MFSLDDVLMIFAELTVFVAIDAGDSGVGEHVIRLYVDEEEIVRSADGSNLIASS